MDEGLPTDPCRLGKAKVQESVHDGFLHDEHPLSQTDAVRHGANVKRVAPHVMRFLISTGCFTSDAILFIKQYVKYDVSSCTPSTLTITSASGGKRPRQGPAGGGGNQAQQGPPQQGSRPTDLHQGDAACSQDVDLEATLAVEGARNRTAMAPPSASHLLRSPTQSPVNKRSKQEGGVNERRPRRAGAGTNRTLFPLQ